MKSYITTPIYYVNGSPHIGHAFTSVMADILKRNRLALGYELLLSTGVDEHGQKNQEAAAALGMSVEEFLDMRGKEFRSVFDRLGVAYDYFVRTSREGHKQAVAAMEQSIYDKGLIVKKQYTGTYCKGCEEFKKESDLTEEGQCPLHPTMTVEQTDETNYFLKMEPYRERLLQHIADNPDFVQPEAFRNELKKMLSEPLDDLCISRPKTRVTLGVELPFDPDFVTYVWFDALANYLTNIGWPSEGYESWWAECEHLIGKDILKPHGVYWPIMLMAAELPLPKKLTVHSHWVGAGGVKMSKSIGNVVDPVEVVDKLGVDALRWYLARHMRADSDSQISVEFITQSYNTELGNKIGNLLSRAAKFSKARFDGKLPAPGPLSAQDEAIRKAVVEATRDMGEWMNLADIPVRMQSIITVADEMNNYFAEQAPWDLIKNDETRERCETVIYVTLDCLRIVMEALLQVIPESAGKALAMLNAPDAAAPWKPELDRLKGGGELNEIETLFPRVQ
ncbi:methionine--tRNA ligase [Roseibium salinum]|uniref:Methionine--tRNA ligase n=1 Tax=Roseibium salinum TaxID=1604349 RepID=A0ABT3R2E4_9HYPH|nr:methionine--tRNA ligase [Roseibium sp. DSM 29163]MCX2723363.1 methionine--tRNA ligase [Roseibium sp. DSM 29163]MDN3718739.1 methionine--tRNA ligase [Roseibium salinum]